MKFPEDHIQKYDRENLLKDILSLPQQLLQGYELAKDVDFEDKIFSNIVIAGMGGSSIAGYLLKTYLRQSCELPVLLTRDYNLPKVVTKESLVICVSYSGNTEETLSSLREANRKRYRTVAMSVGGKVEEVCKISKIQWVQLPRGHQPRATTGYQFAALLRILENLDIIKNPLPDIKKAAKALSKDSFRKPAIDLSEKLYGKIPVIYASEAFHSVCYRWQCELNENAKVMAISNVFSELNHNEIMGYTNSDKQGSFYAVFLEYEDDLPRIKKRMKITKELIQNRGIPVTEISIKGNNLLTRLFSGVFIGDLTSYYLALRYEKDPSDVEDIKSLKKQLGPFV